MAERGEPPPMMSEQERHAACNSLLFGLRISAKDDGMYIGEPNAVAVAPER